MLNVLAEAKNGDICQYNLVQLPFVGPALCDQRLKTMLAFFRITLWHARPYNVNLKKKTSSLPWFYSRKAANQRSGRCVFCFFCKNRWKKVQHSCWCWTQVEEKSPFAIHRSQAIPVLLWSGVWRDRQACFWLSVGRFLRPQDHLSSVICPWTTSEGFRLHNKLLQESSWCFHHYGLTLHSANC